jgi:hypothetical protein
MKNEVKTIADEIRKSMGSGLVKIINKHAVSFYRHQFEEAGFEFEVEYNLQITDTADGVTLSYGGFYETIEDFVNRFGLLSEGDVYNITSEQLRQMYEEGELHIFCGLEMLKGLVFIKDGPLLYANSRAQGNSHVVTDCLVTPDDFLNYTKGYYSRVEGKFLSGSIKSGN